MKVAKIMLELIQQNKAVQVQVIADTVMDQYINLNVYNLKIIKDGKFRIMVFSQELTL